MTKPIKDITLSVRTSSGQPVKSKVSIQANGVANLTMTIPKAPDVVPAAAGDTTQWAIVITAPIYNNPSGDKYVVQKAAVNVSDEWEGDGDDIDIERALTYESNDVYAEDIRNWSPFYLADSIIKIVSRWDEAADDFIWFIDMTMLYGGRESKASIRFNTDDNITQAVWA